MRKIKILRIALYMVIASSLSALSAPNTLNLNIGIEDIIHVRIDSCHLDIPADGSWTGETLNNTGGKTGHSNNILVEKKGELSFSISDFSAGLLDQLGQGTQHVVVITFDCDGEVIPTNFTSDWGEVSISGGYWDTTKSEITFHWDIPFNKISETSVITFNN